ncbi:MAG: hypothetical protein H6R18_3033, partial [Proteobacteria bacterium]|nr:hypothetical protein [Pseudomonadota bacterium]
LAEQEKSLQEQDLDRFVTALPQAYPQIL